MRAESAAFESHVRDATQLLQHSRPAAAEARCRQALALRPRHPIALNLLAIALNAQGRCAEAAAAFDALTRLEPHSPSHWMNLGTALRGARRFDDALRAYAEAAHRGAASADFFYNVGLLHIDRGDFDSARSVLKRAASLAPRDGEIAHQLAYCCYEAMRLEEASATLEHWERFEGLTAELAARIALLLVNLGEPRRAEPVLARAARDGTASGAALLTIAQVLERTNRTDEARAALERARAHPDAPPDPRDLLIAEAQLAQRAGEHELACSRYRQALAGVADSHRRHYHLYPLAKSLDALGRCEEAFEALTEAHASQTAFVRLAMPSAAAAGPPRLHITQFGCDPADVAAWSTAAAPPLEASPVFIVAFPRSGTTLLEQVLDAHPQLRSMDEQPFLQKAIDRILDHGVRYPAGLGRLTEAQLHEVREAYWALVRGKVELAPGQRLVDKNPLNLLRLPAIRRLFPASPIVLAIRHPCDVILSCYMQHFRAPEFVLLCRDLPTLAAGYRQAFDFWYSQAALLDPPVREVRYERFVAAFEAEVRALADFLALPWSEAMLAPAENARTRGFISTPSYAQVLQPVTTRSVGRWKRYAEHFTDVLPIVQPLLERWGYGP